MQRISISDIDHDKFVDLPQSIHQKVLIFDLDETLIHCVDDVETQNPDVIIEVDFPDGELAYAGINIRPFALECLIEANKYMQVGVFTAST